MADTNENDRKKCYSAKRLTKEEINERMKKVGDGWTLREGRLTNTFSVGNKNRDSFSKAFSFAQTVAQLSERYCHHPEIIIKWGSCEVTFWTYSIDGLSAIDFEMADRVYEAFDKPLYPYPTSFNDARAERRYSLPLPMERGTYGSSPDPRKKTNIFSREKPLEIKRGNGGYMERRRGSPLYRQQPH